MTSIAHAGTEALVPDDWQARRDRHRERVEPWLAPRLQRRLRGEKHPIDDFLFDYYPYRPGQLRRYHPGIGVALLGDPRTLGEYAADPDYTAASGGVTADPGRVARHAERLRWTVDLLASTRQRPPGTSCFGLHEWAMVYRLPREQVRHAEWPLRLPPEEIAAVVDEVGLRCTHFDAFRFFSPAARPLNLTVLTREDQPAHEQPGCLHAAMDLYKYAFWFSPFVDSDLVADAFELAREMRTIDMRSSPYDVGRYGLEPIRVETPEGRAEFATLARGCSRRAEGLRDRLLHRLEALTEDR